MRFGFKGLLLGVLTLGLLIPLSLLRGLVLERQQRATEVRNEIANSSSRAQVLTGPLLVLTVNRLVRIRHKTEVGGVEQEKSENVWHTDRRLIAPDRLAIGNLLGTRLVLNEFVAFLKLGPTGPRSAKGTY